ncbi:helix-turn-helix domain-containing protein [Pseudomonadota bacterium AL_CKDN230030165-1A_HGKHYDSX7]
MKYTPTLSDEESPHPEEIKQLRVKTRRTQQQVAQILDVALRHVQRWETGERTMPPATWRFLKMCGHRRPADFEVPENGSTRWWDQARDTQRTTIERNDFVYLQPVVGPLIQARVWLDRVNDGLIDEEHYGAFVFGFPGHPEAGQEFGGFYVGESITFAARNVVHLEQRMSSIAPMAIETAQLQGA